MSFTLYINGFWQNFDDKDKDPVTHHFFVELFTKVFDVPINDVIYCDKNNSQTCPFLSFNGSILLESVFMEIPAVQSLVWKDTWTHTFLFCGETSGQLNKFEQRHLDKYDCILTGERNHTNIINMPLYIPYIYNNPHILDKLEKLEKLEKINQPALHPQTVPQKNICAVISNPNGKERNRLIAEIEKHVPIDHAGKYRTNVPIIAGNYGSPELTDFISQYKFVIAMENYSCETYITEKIIHGFTTNTIPIYWGSPRIADHFNENRFIHVKNDNIEQTIKNTINNEEAFIAKINEPIFGKNRRTLEDVAKDIRGLLSKKHEPSNPINQIFVISSPEYEKHRYDKIHETFFENPHPLLNPQITTFYCPTYKHTITEEDMAEHGRQFSNNTASVNSLFINHKMIFEHIERNYKDGMFLVMESDVQPFQREPIPFKESLNTIVQFLNTHKDKWDVVSLSSSFNTLPIFKNLPSISINGEYRISPVKRSNCTDSILWNYSGIQKILKCMAKKAMQNLPIDNYLNYAYHTYPEIRPFLLFDPIFYQTSILDISTTTL
jgi:hypothetical protein